MVLTDRSWSNFFLNILKLIFFILAMIYINVNAPDDAMYGAISKKSVCSNNFRKIGNFMKKG
jgi:hypothetical protein